MMLTLKKERTTRMPTRYWDWDPFKEFSRIHRLMNELMSDVFGYEYSPTYTTPSEMTKSTWTPPMNMYFKDENTIMMHFYLPGMNKENIELSVTPNTITISGNMPKMDINDENWVTWEYPCMGKFYRHVELPYEIVPNKVTATYENGVLIVTCPLKTSEKEHVKVNIS